MNRQSACFLIIATIMSVVVVNGFSPSSISSRRRPTLTTNTRPKTELSGSLLRDPSAVAKLVSPIGASTMAFPMLLASTAPFGLTTDNIATTSLQTFEALQQEADIPVDVEAQVLGGFSHVALDLLTFFLPSASIYVRGAAVVGRIFSMLADYIPDHSMEPEELFFQVLMLGISWALLIRSTLPLALANFATNITIRDGKAFSSLFRPAGMTWVQFKALSACAMDWVTVDAGTCIMTDEGEAGKRFIPGNDDCIYWLYSGDVTVCSNGKDLYNVSSDGGRGSMKRDAPRGLLGEMDLLRQLERTNTMTTKTTQQLQTTVTAGSAGATLLRIHKGNLSLLMQNDPDLASSVRTLLFQGLQAKLAAQVLNTGSL